MYGARSALATRQGSRESISGRAIAKPDHHWDATHTIALCQRLVIVYIDLRQYEGSIHFTDEPLQDRTKDTTRTTPGCPKVDDDRHLARMLDHRCFPILLADITMTPAPCSDRVVITPLSIRGIVITNPLRGDNEKFTAQHLAWRETCGKLRY